MKIKHKISGVEVNNVKERKEKYVKERPHSTIIYPKDQGWSEVKDDVWEDVTQSMASDDNALYYVDESDQWEAIEGLANYRVVTRRDYILVEKRVES